MPETVGDGFSEMTVAGLKKACQSKGIKSTGAKDDLIARLRAAEEPPPSPELGSPMSSPRKGKKKSEAEILQDIKQSGRSKRTLAMSSPLSHGDGKGAAPESRSKQGAAGQKSQKPQISPEGGAPTSATAKPSFRNLDSSDEEDDQDDKIASDALQNLSFLSTNATSSAQESFSQQNIITTLVSSALKNQGASGEDKTDAWKSAVNSKMTLESKLSAPRHAVALLPGGRSAPVLKKREEERVDGLMEKAQDLSKLDKKVLVEKPGRRVKGPSDTEKHVARNWFGMQSSEVDENARKTLAILANRHAIDPKRFYRKENRKTGEIPKHFQVGTVMQGATEFYSARMNRSERKSNLAEELLGDDRLRPYIKRKFSELQTTSMAHGKMANKKQQQKRMPKWRQAAEAGRKKKQKRR